MSPGIRGTVRAPQLTGSCVRRGERGEPLGLVLPTLGRLWEDSGIRGSFEWLCRAWGLRQELPSLAFNGFQNPRAGQGRRQGGASLDIGRALGHRASLTTLSYGFFSRNWCPYQKSRLVTFVAACKTEKFLVHSQQPCPQGAPDCQRAKAM